MENSHHKHHRRRRYQNILMVLAGVILTIIFGKTPTLQNFIVYSSNYPVITAFVGGILFTSTFTISIGALIILKLASLFSPISVVIVSSLGAVFFDFIIFRLVRNKVSAHISPIYDDLFNHSHLGKILHTHYFAWTLPVIGALIFASPIPDELAVSLLSISKMDSSKFLTLAFFCHLFGLGILVTAIHFL